MISFLKKLIFGLVAVAVIAILALIGFNVYINYQTYGFKREKENERLQKQKERDDKEKLDREIAEMQKDALEGWSPKGKGKILRAEDINHLGILEHSEITCIKCNACDNCHNGEECLEMKPRLIFSDEVNKYLRDTLQAIINFKNGSDLDDDDYGDNVSPYLKRHNAVLYGAPGTGKTELVNELVHHLQDKFGDPHNEISDSKKEIQKLEKELDQLKAKAEIAGNRDAENVTLEDKVLNKQIDDLRNKINNKNRTLQKLEKQYRVPPVFKVDGAKLQTAGEALGQPNPEQKLIKIIEFCKKEAFEGNAYSNEPYIVFVEEADQGKNVMTADKNNLLEEYKNFLSTTEDKMGLRAQAQDQNSIIIIATNNFDKIDPAVVRRGRLGEKLNFNWSPYLLEKYGDRGDAEWEKVRWPKNDLSWQFEGNVNYWELYALASRFGYSTFADRFTIKHKARYNDGSIINKANQIIDSYKELSRNEEWKKAKEKELGKLPTGKKITVNGKEEDEKVCNWLLHFLHTFHRYNDQQNLKSFRSANDIRPYDFGEAFATREAIWGIYRRIGEQCKVLEVANDLSAKLAEEVGNIRGLLLETQDVKNQFIDVQNKINEIEHSSDTMREFLNSNLKTLNDRINLIGLPNNEVSNLSSRIATLESRISNLGNSSGSGSSGGSIPMNKVNTVGSKISELQNAINDLVTRIQNKSDPASAISSLNNKMTELFSSYNAL